MPGDAFMGGVKAGGLNSVTEIRLLLCYLIKNTAPVPSSVLQEALLKEELVNYFEMADALAHLEENGLILCGEDGYTVTEKGAGIADTLADELPHTVRRKASRAVLRAMAWLRKEAQHRAEISQQDGQWFVRCSIAEQGQELFFLRLGMPDRLTAETVRRRFIADGSGIYALLLNRLTEPLDDDPDEE